MRQWPKTVIAVAASVVVLAAASGVHYRYSGEVFAESGDGAWVANPDGFEWRLDGWTAQATWEDAFDPPAPGAVFVFVTASVRAPSDPGKSFLCDARLIGRDTEWTVIVGESEYDTPMAACRKAVADKQEVSIVLHYEVPEIWATPEWIRGIAFSHRMGFAPTPLLTTTREG